MTVLRRFSRSLSIRLLAIFVVLAALFVLGTTVAIQRFYNSAEIRGLISGHLSLHVNYVLEDIGSPPRIDRAIGITKRVPVDIRILGPSLDWATDPEFPRLDELDFAPSPKFSNDPGAWIDELDGVDFARREQHNFLRMRQGDYQIVVSSPRISDVSDGPGLVSSILALGLFFLILGYVAVQWLFKPIRTIRAGAAEIGHGNFKHRIDRIRGDQLGDLAADINRLAGNVEGMLDAKRSLLLGISHELRTPLSRMRLELEFLEDETKAESLRAEIIEMEEIVVALLEADRLNDQHAALSRTAVNVRDLLHRIRDQFFDREKKRLSFDVDEGLGEVMIDEARVMLLLKNLIANALRYSDSSDPVHVSAQRNADDLVLRVADNGPGLSADQAARIGEPFYRSDPSRTRASGGTGLGLYLAYLVAKAHGGSLTLVENSSDGAAFEARIRLSD